MTESTYTSYRTKLYINVRKNNPTYTNVWWTIFIRHDRFVITDCVALYIRPAMHATCTHTWPFVCHILNSILYPHHVWVWGERQYNVCLCVYVRCPAISQIAWTRRSRNYGRRTALTHIDGVFTEERAVGL